MVTPTNPPEVDSKEALIDELKTKIADFKGLLAMRDDNLLQTFIETQIEPLLNQLD